MFDQTKIVHKLTLAISNIRGKQSSIESMVFDLNRALTEANGEIEETVRVLEESADHMRIQSLIKKKLKAMNKSVKQEQERKTSLSPLKSLAGIPKLPVCRSSPMIQTMKALKKLKKLNAKKFHTSCKLGNMC